MSQGENIMCEHCKFWNDPDHADEEFCYLWGTYWFNIPKAYQIVQGREPQEVPTAAAAGWVEYPPRADGSFNILKRHVLVEHLDHVDMSKPVMFARYPATSVDADKLKDSALLIDGTHRIARAVRDGHPTVKIFLLSHEETESILLDNSGRKKPKPKTKPKPRKPRKKCDSTAASTID